MLVSALDCLRTKTAVSSSGLSFQASSHWPCAAWCGRGASQSRSARAMSKPTESALALSSSWLASQRQAVVEPGPMPATRFGLPPRRAMTASSRDCCALQSPFSGGSTGSPGRRCREPGSASGRRSVAVRGRRSPPPASAASRRVRQGWRGRRRRGPGLPVSPGPPVGSRAAGRHRRSAPGRRPENGASDVSRQTYQRFTNPVRPPAISAAVSARATSGSSPAGTAR